MSEKRFQSSGGEHTEETALIWGDDQQRAAKNNSVAVYQILVIISSLVAVGCAIGLGFVVLGDELRPADKASCSNFGIREPDGSSCLCFDCYSGPTCATKDAQCPVKAGVADASMYEQYFEDYAYGNEWRVSIPSWYRPAYQSPFVLGAFPSALNERALQALLTLHDYVGHVNTSQRVALLGFGATQVVQALIEAIATKKGKSMWIYAKPPSYPTFELWAQNSKHSLGFTRRTDLDPADVIEIVTWPGNPSGSYEAPAYPQAAHIYDLVYLWPQSWGSSPPDMLDEDIMVFSASKFTGHASSRFGWAWVRDPEIAYNTIGFFFSQTFGISVDSVWRIVQIQEQLVKQPIDNGFISYAKKKFEARWADLLAAFQGTDFELNSAPNTWFAWIKCPMRLLVNTTTCGDIFLANGIAGSYGDGETGVDHHNRLNLNIRDHEWPRFMENLKHILLL